MFLDPSSQYRNRFRLAEEIPKRLQTHLIEGSSRKCLIGDGMHLLSQWIDYTEFDFFIHHIFCKTHIELFGKTQDRKWLWVMQYRGDARVSLSSSIELAVPEGSHMVVRTEAGKEVRFTVARGSATIIMINLKLTGEKTLRQFYPKLWKQVYMAHAAHVYSSIYIEQYYWERLSAPNVPAVLLPAFLSAQWRELLLRFSMQLLEAPRFPGIPAAQQEKVVLAKQLLDQYPGESWTLRELARQTNWNLQDLKTVFARAYRQTPIEYLRHVRLQLALMLVRSSVKTVAEISRDCGFKRSHHFIRMFKMVTGKTPGQLRRRE